MLPPIQARKPRKLAQISPITASSTRRFFPPNRLRSSSTLIIAPWRKASATPSSTVQIRRARVSTSLQSAGECSTKRAMTW
ncbi:hypothetical protein D3C78_1747890 [compost metagenome]